MKKNSLLMKFAVLTGLILASLNLTAQRGNYHWAKQGRNPNSPKQEFCLSMLDLSDEQKEQIKQLRITHLKEVKGLKNELNEKMAKHQTLITADKTNMDDIYKNIDEITQIKNKLMKEKAAHQQAVRNLLTEEQKVFFDHHLMRKGKCRYGYGWKNKSAGYCFMSDLSDLDFVDLVEE